jgi:hypothetical protein
MLVEAALAMLMVAAACGWIGWGQAAACGVLVLLAAGAVAMLTDVGAASRTHEE